MCSSDLGPHHFRNLVDDDVVVAKKPLSSQRHKTLKEAVGGDDILTLKNHALKALGLRWGVIVVGVRLLEWDRFRTLNDPVDLSQQGHDHKVLTVTEPLDHRGGLAASAGIVMDGYGGLHLVLLNAKRPKTDGRPQGACNVLITLG